MRINTVILDYGHVLSFPPQPSDYQRAAALSGIDRNPFEKVYWSNRADYDRGSIDGPTYWRRIARATGRELTLDQIDSLIANDIAIWMHANSVMMDWTRALKRGGLKIAILSNMPIEISRYMRQYAPWFRDFDHVCFSAEVQLAKPGAAIYHACLEALHSQPEECLFIDDRDENVEAARALGMYALKFVSVHELALEVQPFDLPAPLDAGGRGMAV